MLRWRVSCRRWKDGSIGGNLTVSLEISYAMTPSISAARGADWLPVLAVRTCRVDGTTSNLSGLQTGWVAQPSAKIWCVYRSPRTVC